MANSLEENDTFSKTNVLNTLERLDSVHGGEHTGWNNVLPVLFLSEYLQIFL